MVFKVFRKHQKKMMAGLILLAMVAFILADFLQRLGDRFDSRSQDRPAAYLTAWNNQPILESQVAAMQNERQALNRFLEQATALAGTPQRWMRFHRPTERDLVIRALVLEAKAQRLGIAVSEEDVSDFIKDLTQKKLSRTSFQSALAAAGKVYPLDEQELYRILGRELRIERAVTALASPVALDTPLEVFEERRPLHTHVRLSLLRLPVAEFMGEVQGTPDETELKKVYDEFKDQVADPETGTIGFRRPHRISVQYVEVPVEEYLERHASQITVTDEEVAKYYDEHRQEFAIKPSPAERNLPGPPIGPLPPSKPETPGSAPPSPPAPADPKEKPSAPKDKDPKQSSPTEGPNAEPTAVPKEGPKAEPKSPPPPAPSAPPKDSSKQKDGTAGTRRLSPLVGAVLSTALAAADPPSPPEAATKGESGPASKSEPAEPPAAKETSAKDAPAKDAPAKDAEPASGSPSAQEAKPVPVKKLEPQYEPLDVVAPRIATILKKNKARQMARKELESLLSGVMFTQRDRYWSSMLRHRKTKEDFSEQERKLVSAAKEALIEKARELGWEAKQTGLITAREAAGLPGLGQAGREGSVTGETFATSAFEGQDLLSGRLLQSPDEGALYVYWKFADEPASTPSLDTVREEVIAAWRLRRAQPLAKEAGQKIADAAAQQGGDLEKGLAAWFEKQDSSKESSKKESAQAPTFEILTTESFPRKVRDNNPVFQFIGQAMIRDAEIPQVPHAGPEFLDAVFAMKVGEMRVLADSLAQNEYVVKVVERRERSFEEFIVDFNTELRWRSMMPFPDPGRTVEDICAEAGLKLVQGPG